MKKYIKDHRLSCVLLIFLFAFSFSSYAQDFIKYDDVNPEDLSEEALRHYNHYSSKTNVKHLELVRIFTDKLNDTRLSFRLENGNPHEIRINSSEKRSIGINSYFGELQDETGIFFTVKDKQLISKFYDGFDAMTILPLEDNIHMLLRYAEDYDHAECGAPDSEEDENQNIHSQNSRNDNGCKVRIQINFTDDAVAVVPGDLHLFAYSAIDESNLAFSRSSTVIRYEIATVRVHNAVENLNRVSNRVVELQQYFDNDNPYQNVNVWRNNYRADLNILIVSQNMDGGGLFGQVIAVGVNAANAYAICSVPGITDGRFTFTHELGHIMGARHENHGTNYNRGMVISPGTTANRRRTIMARTGAAPCALATSCRIQNFSNPNVNWAGMATGNATTADNARWLDEQANNIRNFRQNVGGTLTINPETIGNNVMGNYTADTGISTNGNVICNNNGELNFRAGTRIDLNNGFRINSGGTFAAILGNCNANYPRGAEEVEEQTVAVSDIAEAESNIHIMPNPMQDQAKIVFTILDNGPVTITLSDANGKFVATILNNTEMAAGSHDVQFENNSMSHGIYYINITTNEYVETKKIMIVR